MCADVPCGVRWCLPDRTTPMSFTCKFPKPYYGESCEFEGVEGGGSALL